MSRRDSDSKHHRSRFDHREPPTSPKRARRDGKTETERPASMLNLDNVDRNGRDQKHHRRLQDSVHMDTKVATDSKIEPESLSKTSDKKSNGYREATKNSSGNIEHTLPRSHYQHDERAGQGRSYRHRETTERERWKDSRGHQSGRATNRSSANDDTKVRDEKTRFDGSYKVESSLKQQTSKKRPSFRETKLPVDTVTGDKPTTQVTKLPDNNDGSERKEERRNLQEKSLVDRHMTDMQRTRFQSSDRNSGGFGGSFKGRDRFNGRQSGGGHVDKWKHDLYDEANKSPKTKNEEDQIAKVEALLAS